MAPIQTYTTFANQSCAFNMAPYVCHCGGLSKDCGELWLPISRRGHFFHDSFFENVHSYFDSAIREILSKWGDRDRLLGEAFQCKDRSTNSFSIYRQLRSSDNREDHASTVVSDDRTHKVVVDVQDFMEGDIKVKVLGEKEVVVEGQSSFPSRSFCRKFTFPSTVNMAEVTSVLSSDGVLTIEAPKVDVISHQKVTEETSTASSSESVSSGCASASGKSDVVYYCKGCNKKIGGSWHAAPETKAAQQVKVPIKIEATTKEVPHIVPHLQEVSSDFSRQTEHNTTGKTNQVKDSTKREAVLKINSLQEVNTNDGEMTAKCQSHVQNNSYEVPVETSYSFLPVSIRGPFFSDSFFRDIHKDFQSAVQQVLSRWGGSSSMLMDDDLSAYRRLRLNHLKEETQAVKTIEDESSHKFVLDVHDFINGGEVTVKAINDREIVVEGHTEMVEGVSKSMKRFMKRFSVPGNMRLDSISSVMSSDGVLTITAPKKSFPVHPKEVIIPVSLEGNEKVQTCHSSSPLLDGQNSGKNGSSAFNINGNRTSTITHSEIQNQVRPSNEHIIPISIEGSLSNAETSSANHKMHVQKEFSESQIGRTNHQLHQETGSREYIIPVNVEGSSGDLRSHATEIQSKLSVQNQEIQQNSNGEQTQKNRGAGDRIIPINVEGSSGSIKTQAFKHQQIHEHQTSSNRVIPITVEGTLSDAETKTFDHNTKVQKETDGNHFCNVRHSEEAQGNAKHQQTTVNESAFMKSMKENANAAFTHSDECHSASQRIQGANREKNVVQNQQYNHIASSSTKRYLPINRRGLFLEDSFFSDYQNDFQAAVKDVLIKCRQCIDVTDYMTAYRNLRQKDLKVENQALYAQEDQESFKIAVDAKDFVDGDITVYVDGEELVIAGKAENSEAKSSNSLTFSHRFLLPESFSISTISSAISSDGILTVNCPKRTDSGSEGVRKMSTEARSQQESQREGGHKWEEKRVKESSEQAEGYSSRTYSSSYSSHQKQSSKF